MEFIKNTDNFVIRDGDNDIFNGSLDKYFIHYDKKNRILSIRDIHSASKIDLNLNDFGQISNINDFLLDTASKIFSNFTLPYTLPPGQNIIAYNEYVLVVDTYIRMISVRNVFDVELINSKFNSDVIFKFVNSNVFKLDVAVKRPDVSRYKTEINSNFIPEDPIVDNGSVGTTAQISTDLNNSVVTGSDLKIYSPIATDIEFSANSAGKMLDANRVIDEDSMASNSDLNIPTQQSVKAYVDNSISGLSIPDEVVKNNGALSGAAPAGVNMGIDTSTGTLYYVNGGNWSPVPTATIDLNTTISEEFGSTGTGLLTPTSPPIADTDVGDLHIELYDDVTLYFTAISNDWLNPAVIESPRDIINFADATVKPDDLVGDGGTANTAARSDHKHPAQSPSTEANNAIVEGGDDLHHVPIAGDADITSSASGQMLDASRVIDEDDMVSDSNTSIPTQQSVKAYVDSKKGYEALDILSGSTIDLDDAPQQSSNYVLPINGNTTVSNVPPGDTDTGSHLQFIRWTTLTGGTDSGYIEYISDDGLGNIKTFIRHRRSSSWGNWLELSGVNNIGSNDQNITSARSITMNGNDITFNGTENIVVRDDGTIILRGLIMPQVSNNASLSITPDISTNQNLQYIINNSSTGDIIINSAIGSLNGDQTFIICLNNQDVIDRTIKFADYDYQDGKADNIPAIILKSGEKASYLFVGGTTGSPSTLAGYIASESTSGLVNETITKSIPSWNPDSSIDNNKFIELNLSDVGSTSTFTKASWGYSYCQVTVLDGGQPLTISVSGYTNVYLRSLVQPTNPTPKINTFDVWEFYADESTDSFIGRQIYTSSFDNVAPFQNFFLREPDSGEGEIILNRDKLGGGLYAAVIKDNGTITSARFRRSYAQRLETGQSIQFRFDFESESVSNHVIELGIDGSGGDSTLALIDLGTAYSGQNRLLQVTDGGNLTGTFTITEIDRGTYDLIRVDMIITATDTLSLFTDFKLRPVYNLDGSNIEDVSATGFINLIGTERGAPSEFSPIEVVATTIDSNTSETLEILDAASEGAIKFFVNKDVRNNKAALTVQSGEMLNGVIDGLFYFSNYSNGTQFKATSDSTGSWNVSVSGAFAESVKGFYHFEGAFDQIDNTNTNNDFEPLPPSAAIASTGAGSYHVDPANEKDPNGYRNGDIITLPAGNWKIEYTVDHPSFEISGGGGNVQESLTTHFALLRLNGSEIHYGLEAENGSGDYGGPSLLSRSFTFTSPTTIELGHTVDADLGASNFEDFAISFTATEINEPKEVIIAGMVEPTTLYHVTYSLSSDATGIVCPFDIGQGDTSIITNSSGTISLPTGKYRIISHATRHAANLDYELYDVTNSISLTQSTVLNNSTASNGDTKPYYLTVSSPIDIQVREGDNGTSITWNGEQSGIDGGWDNVQPTFGCYIDIQQLPHSSVVMPDSLPVENLETILFSGSLSSGSVGNISDNWDYVLANYEKIKVSLYDSNRSRSITEIYTSEIILGTTILSTSIGTNTTVDITGLDSGVSSFVYTNTDGTTVDNIKIIGVKAQKTVVNTIDTPVDDQTSSGYMDIGNMRQQWGEEADGTLGIHTVTLPNPMSNTNYSISHTFVGSVTGSLTLTITNRTTTSFTVSKKYIDGTITDAIEGFTWHVIGEKP